MMSCCIDDDEPSWESSGYRRDLRRQPPRDPEVSSSMFDWLAARPLPFVGNLESAKGGDSWNLEQCEYGLNCGDPACYKFHHVIERRCRKFTLLGYNACRGCEGGCVHGLHVKAADVCQTYTLNLFRMEVNLVEAAQLLEA